MADGQITPIGFAVLLSLLGLIVTVILTSQIASLVQGADLLPPTMRWWFQLPERASGSTLLREGLARSLIVFGAQGTILLGIVLPTTGFGTLERLCLLSEIVLFLTWIGFLAVRFSTNRA